MKPLQLAVVISITLVAGALVLSLNKPSAASETAANNVSIVDGQQIIDITAKGGYTPRTTTAKAGIPTIIRFHTSGTFDCSSYIRIPSMDVSRNLPSTGITDVAIANPSAGLLNGMCGMGMYPFQVNFQS